MNTIMLPWQLQTNLLGICFRPRLIQHYAHHKTAVMLGLFPLAVSHEGLDRWQKYSLATKYLLSFAPTISINAAHAMLVLSQIFLKLQYDVMGRFHFIFVGWYFCLAFSSEILLTYCRYSSFKLLPKWCLLLGIILRILAASTLSRVDHVSGLFSTFYSPHHPVHSSWLPLSPARIWSGTPC